MMKKTLILIFAILMTSLPATAFDHQYSAQNQQGMSLEEENILGLWVLTARRCLSGAPVLDNYDIARDSTQIRYRESSFEYHSTSNGCHFWSKGNYEIVGPMIIYKNIRGSSTCGPSNYRSRDQNSFQLNADKLSLFFGPFLQGPAPCPMRDLLEVKYKKVP